MGSADMKNTNPMNNAKRMKGVNMLHAGHKPTHNLRIQTKINTNLVSVAELFTNPIHIFLQGINMQLIKTDFKVCVKFSQLHKI